MSIKNFQQKTRNLLSFFMNYLDKTVIILIAIIPLLLIPAFYSNKFTKAPVRSDGTGYFLYLPATIIYQDLKLDFFIDESKPYTAGKNVFDRTYNQEEAKTAGVRKIDNGNYLNKYTVGVAIMLLPFYLVGHVFTLIFNSANATGWSFFYQYFALYGGITYFLIGLKILKDILRKYFTISTTFLTLFAIVFGTNLFNYAFYENIFSHVYGFFIITLLIKLVPKWLRNFNLRNSLIIGVLFGLAVAIRQTHIILVFIPLFYSVCNFKDLRNRFLVFLKNYRYLLVAILTAFLVFLPQLLYWKYITGQWVYFSYHHESFDFYNPQILKVLFSVRKGLFFWSPVLLFSIFGIIFNKIKIRKYLLTFLIILSLQIYIVSSWWSWEFGWSFGHRGFTDFSGFFALGLASFIHLFKNSKIKTLVTSILILLTGLSTFQMFQYWLRILPPAKSTWYDYRKIFLKIDPDLRYYWRDKFNPKKK